MNRTSIRQPLPIHRAGTAIQRSPEGIANAPFWVEMLVQDNEDGRLTAMRCTLEPGTMTRWHTHPHGQILYVLSGVGLAQRDNELAEELRAGDCITFAPGERHRHGATLDSTFAYISIQAQQNGDAVTWLED
ncbi:cupin domain-containing protein [Rhizobium leucaenae]|uniref:Quercetin dioxygenase-like cupin family protein n=1 Tax=Rhizobium leucaenae TaxID=29450 RepID=A0A7W6ZPP5_9HYPH|nr:cupin domain-containing protein [Rhizobium leucaenae]MBB4566452.1 quercetin dioxygenase-like cupin family protein [Rhizobium leucaenae]